MSVKKPLILLNNFLCLEAVLQSPDFSKRFIVQVDASDVGLGAVLVQGKAYDERPVLFLSRKLFERELRYSTVRKEILTIKWVVNSLDHYLLGHEFTLRTNHQALKWMQTMQNSNSRILRWCLTLQNPGFHCTWQMADSVSGVVWVSGLLMSTL